MVPQEDHRMPDSSDPAELQAMLQRVLDEEAATCKDRG
jgi:hypothetical protein